MMKPLIGTVRNVPKSGKISFPAMLIRLYWPKCPFRNGSWEQIPIDAYWVECTAQEAEDHVYPLLDEVLVKKSREMASKKCDLDFDRPYCFLVAKDLSFIDPFFPHYPSANLWNAYSPFRDIEPRDINDLQEIENLVPDNAHRPI